MCHRLVRGKTLLPDSYPSLAVFAMVVLLPFPAITSNSPQPKAFGTMARAIDTSGSTNSTAAVPSEKSDGQTEYRPSNARLAIDEVNRAILKPRSGQWADLGIGRVSAAQFSGNGELLAVGTFNGRLEVYDTEQAVRRHEFEAGNSKVNSIAFSPDDQMLVVGTRDGTCRLIDLCQDQKDVVRRRRGSSVTCVRFSRCGRFASVVWQRRSRQLVEFWDLLSSRVTSTPSTDIGIVAALDFSEDSSDVPNWQFVLTDGTFCHCDASSSGIVFAKSSRPRLTSATLEQLRLPTSPASSLR